MRCTDRPGFRPDPDDIAIVFDGLVIQCRVCLLPDINAHLEKNYVNWWTTRSDSRFLFYEQCDDVRHPKTEPLLQRAAATAEQVTRELSGRFFETLRINNSTAGKRCFRAILRLKAALRNTTEIDDRFWSYQADKGERHG